MINKLKILFKKFNINTNEIPLFLKDFGIRYNTVLNDENFSKKIDDKLIDYIVETLHINKQWLYENSDEIIKTEPYGYYKRAEVFCNEILSKYPTKLFILTERKPNKDYDEKNDDNHIEIVAEYSLTLSNGKSINSYEVFRSGCRWGYSRCRVELKKFLLCLNKHHFINRVDGKIFVENFDIKFEDFKKGKVTFDDISKQNDRWYPEDYIESKNSNAQAKEDDELIEILKELQENKTKSVSKNKLFKKETDKYILYENNKYNFTIEDLAKRISAYLNTKFLLFREDNIIYTDNEYVLQILKYEVGFLDFISEIVILNDKNNKWLSNEQLSISTDFLIEEKVNTLEFRKNRFQVKWYYIYQKIYDMLFSYLKNTSEVAIGQNIIQRTFGERVFKLLNTNKEFVKHNSWIEKFNDLRSIDPLHLFISFNAANQKDETRINRILILLRSLNSQP